MTARVQRAELADGTAVQLTEPLVELASGRRRAPVVDGYCVRCQAFARGPRYEASTPSDRIDWITGHPGCPKAGAP